MASSIQLLRSTIAQERPFPGNLLEGQPAVNLNSTEPGLFFKAADGSLVKFGPAAITSDGSPPNSSPQGSAGNTIGELWLDKSTDPAVLKVYDGTDWIDAGSGGGGGGGVGSFVRWIYTAIGGETSLSGSSGGVLLDYTPGLEEVFVNGVLITRGTDYSATNGSSITNLAPLTAGDVVTVTSMNPLEVVQLPGQVTLLRWTVLAAAGQTVLSGVDSSSQQLAYTAGFEEVYVNGAFLRRGIDYTATTGTSITLTSPLALDDEITVMSWSPFEVGDITIGTGDIENGAITNEKVNNTAGIISTKLAFFQVGDWTPAISDGTKWVRTVDSKLKDVVSVRDYGAVGDGVNDDTQHVIAALATARTLYFPAGRYKLSQSINLVGGEGSARRIIGDGPAQTELWFTGVNGIYSMNASSSIEELAILNYDANPTNPENPLQANINPALIGLDITRNFHVVKNVLIRGFGTGLVIRDRYYNNLYAVRCSFNLTGFANIDDANFNKSFGCYYSNNFLTNVKVTGGSHTFYGCSIEGAGAYDNNGSNYPDGGILIGESTAYADINRAAGATAVFDGCWFEDINIFANERTTISNQIGKVFRVKARAPLNVVNMYGHTHENLVSPPWLSTWAGSNVTLDTNTSNLNSGRRYALATSSTGTGSNKTTFTAWNDTVRGIVISTAPNADFHIYFGMWVYLETANFTSDYPTIRVQLEDTFGGIFDGETVARTQRIDSTLVGQWQFVGGTFFCRNTFSTGNPLAQVRLRIDMGDNTEDHSVSPRIMRLTDPELRFLFLETGQSPANGAGSSTTFTTVDGKTITVQNGMITGVV